VFFAFDNNLGEEVGLAPLAIGREGVFSCRATSSLGAAPATMLRFCLGVLGEELIAVKVIVEPFCWKVGVVGRIASLPLVSALRD
jgi:hypothetical protein